MSARRPRPAPPKHRAIYDRLRRELDAGIHPEGHRLPTDLQLARAFRVSRPTVARALDDLRREGRIERIAGSGTYVRRPPAAPGARTLGLLIPGLGDTEIFEHICGQMARVAAREQCTLLWGGCGRDAQESQGGQALHACQDFIRRKVDGVFFAPLEFSPDRDEVNRRILRDLAAAGIATVLLDRDLEPFPHRSDLDLVGIDNFRAGFVACDHLLRHGGRRVDFLARPGSAATVERRAAGYRQALLGAGLRPSDDWVHTVDPADPAAARRLVRSGASAVLCANDKTALALMDSLRGLGLRVPGHVRVAGFDDLPFARHLDVPLTTLRQPCEDLGTVALQTMLTRLAEPSLAPRTIQLRCDLVVRASCGCRPARAAGRRAPPPRKGEPDA